MHTCTSLPHLLGKTAISITLIAVHIYVRFTLRPRKEACMKRRKKVSVHVLVPAHSSNMLVPRRYYLPGEEYLPCCGTLDTLMFLVRIIFVGL